MTNFITVKETRRNSGEVDKSLYPNENISLYKTFGAWKDRVDTQKSGMWVRELRSKLSNRNV